MLPEERDARPGDHRRIVKRQYNALRPSAACHRRKTAPEGRAGNRGCTRAREAVAQLIDWSQRANRARQRATSGSTGGDLNWAVPPGSAPPACNHRAINASFARNGLSIGATLATDTLRVQLAAALVAPTIFAGLDDFRSRTSTHENLPFLLQMFGSCGNYGFATPRQRLAAYSSAPECALSPIFIALFHWYRFTTSNQGS